MRRRRRKNEEADRRSREDRRRSEIEKTDVEVSRSEEEPGQKRCGAEKSGTLMCESATWKYRMRTENRPTK